MSAYQSRLVAPGVHIISHRNYPYMIVEDGIVAPMLPTVDASEMVRNLRRLADEVEQFIGVVKP